MAGKWASTDTRRAGIPWLFSPLLGLSWSPRWSRVYETFGEDPVVVGSMAQAMIKGIQEEDDGSLIPSRAAACAKHWVG
jgi:beta-glucosidase